MANYWRIFARQWFLIVLMTILCVGGSAAYSFLATPSYSSDIRLFVKVQDASASAQDLQAASDFSQQRVASYAELIDSPAVLTPVIQELQLPYTVDDLSKQISATTSATTVNLTITVKDSDPRRAAAIANAFAPSFADYVSRVENVSATRTASLVKITVTKPATVATSPDSPQTVLNLILGLFVGLGLGLVAAVVREQTNSFIIGVRDIERVTGSVPLGVVPFDRSTSKRPLARPADQNGRAEAFRGLRTNLQFADVDNPPGRIVITSAVPGEGKSTISANIALTLAVGGAKVALVEADLRDPTLSTYLGITHAAGLTNVLAGQYTLSEVMIRHEASNNLAVLPCGPKPPNPAELLNSTQMEKVLDVLSDHFDYVVIDSPPLLRVTEAAVLAAIADGALIVVRNRRTRRDQLLRAVKSLTTVNARVLGTVLNFAPAKEGAGYGYGYAKNAGANPRHADFFMPQGNMFSELNFSSTPATGVAASARATPPAGPPANSSANSSANPPANSSANAPATLPVKAPGMNGHSDHGHAPSQTSSPFMPPPDLPTTQQPIIQPPDPQRSDNQHPDNQHPVNGELADHEQAQARFRRE